MIAFRYPYIVSNYHSHSSSFCWRGHQTKKSLRSATAQLNPVYSVDVNGEGDGTSKPKDDPTVVKKGQGLAAYMKANGLNYYNKSDRDGTASFMEPYFLV